jgi:hypothetical protein
MCDAILRVKRVGPNHTHANSLLPTPIHRSPTKQNCTYLRLITTVHVTHFLGERCSLHIQSHLQLVLVLGAMVTLIISSFSLI